MHEVGAAELSAYQCMMPLIASSGFLCAISTSNPIACTRLNATRRAYKTSDIVCEFFELELQNWHATFPLPLKRPIFTGARLKLDTTTKGRRIQLCLRLDRGYITHLVYHINMWFKFFVGCAWLTADMYTHWRSQKYPSFAGKRLSYHHQPITRPMTS